MCYLLNIVNMLSTEDNIISNVLSLKKVNVLSTDYSKHLLSTEYNKIVLSTEDNKIVLSLKKVKGIFREVKAK